jgi:pimeloyl-ACP methyl ester carboxylesterase
VADRLRAAGHRAFAPTLTGVGERRHLLSRDITLRTFYQDVAEVIACEELNDVILVGHSFSGIVISGVADMMPERIKQLVYLDAVLMEPGTSMLGDVLPPERAADRRKTAREFSGGLSLPPPHAAALGITDPADQAWVDRRLTPMPFGPFGEKAELKGPLGNSLPRVYIDCMQPPFAAMDSIKQRYRGRPGWPFVPLATGHDAMVTAPAELTAILLRYV